MFQHRFLTSQQYIDHISIFLVFSILRQNHPCSNRALFPRGCRVIFNRAHCPFVPDLSCKHVRLRQWGSLGVFSFPGCCFHHPHFYFYHLLHLCNMSWQWSHYCNPHLILCHSCTHLHNDPAFHI